jgi:hypothetical protein
MAYDNEACGAGCPYWPYDCLTGCRWEEEGFGEGEGR